MRVPYILIAVLGLWSCSPPPSGTPPNGTAAAAVDDNILAGWETPREEVSASRDCVAIDRALLVPVPQDSRPAAMTRLERAPAVPLTDREAAGLIGATLGDGEALATALLRARLREKREQKRLQMEERIGGWSLADDQDLAALSAQLEAGGSRHLRPFLVRAIAKAERTGRLSGCSRADELYLSHDSLGRTVPPSTRLPAIVFLPRLPTRVHASWGMDE